MDTRTEGEDDGKTTPQLSGGTWTDHSSKVLAAFTLGALLTGTVVYQLLEDWGWVDSFYFAVITLTTVGYGDLSPSTTGSKLFTIVYVLSGISLIGAYLNDRAKRRARRTAARRSKS